MPSASYLDYAKMILALPATTAEVAERCGMTERSAGLILRRLWVLRLIHPGELRRCGRHRNPTAVWLQGEGEAAPGLRITKPGKLRAALIAFATIWRALSEGSTAHDIGEENGVSHVSVYRMLAWLKSQKHVHISGYGLDTLGRPVAIWTLGEGRNARRPAAKNASQKSREYRQRKRFAQLTNMGAAA